MSLINEVSADLSDFVVQMGESVAEAKRQIDLASVESLKALAQVDIEIPIVTKSLEGDKIKYTKELVKVSPLSLGMMPTFYEFSKTEIEVSMDFEINGETTSSSNSKTFPKIRSIGINTKKVRQERRLNSKLKGFSSLKIEMVPVPPPSTIPELFIDDTLTPTIRNTLVNNNDSEDV
jgi:hypothetical protein